MNEIFDLFKSIILKNIKILRMLSWLLGSSAGKEEKKQKPVEKKENLLSADELWVYDYIRQYLTSPIWRNPILDFVEQNCTVFQDSEQNKFQYTKIFQEFQSIATIMIQSMLDETGITDKQLQKCIIKGLKGEKDRKIYQQILLCDNFLSFKKIMIAKNKQLELQALKKMQNPTQANKDQVALSQLELERMQIQKAIAISMAMQEKMRQQQQKELEQALKQSSLSAQQEELKQSKKQQEKKPIFEPLPPLVIGTKKENKPIEEYKKQQAQLNKTITNFKKTELSAQQKESADERKKRLQEQRQLIRKKKQQERQEQLQSFIQNKPTGQSASKVVDQKQMERRRNLMKKLKEQLKD